MQERHPNTRLHYRSDARTSPGLWWQGQRIAWWPAHIKPTEDRCLNIYALWEARKEACWPAKPKAFTRDEIALELKDLILI